MNQAQRLGLIAAAATLLAATPLSSIFERWTWFGMCLIAVLAVAGSAALSRALRAPVWAQLLAMVGGLLIGLAWLFPSGAELLALVPTPGTFAHFADLLATTGTEINRHRAPVPDSDPLLFVTVLGVAGVAVVVDLLAVTLRRPALAGLPMLAIYSVPVAVATEGVPPAPFVIGAAGYLWLICADNVDRVRRFGRRFTEDGRDVDTWQPSPLSSAGRRLSVLGVLVAVLLPAAVPGMTGGVLDRFGDGDGGDGPGLNGSSGRVDLFAALSGQLNQGERVDMVRVRTSEKSPFYLRFGVADELFGGGFRVRTPQGRPLQSDGLPLPDSFNLDLDGVRQERHQATVEITDNFRMPLLPVYATPVGTRDIGSRWLYDSERQLIFSRREDSRDMTYSFDYLRSTYTPRALRGAAAVSRDDPAWQQTVVPPVPEVDALVAELTEDERTDYDKVRAIYDHFSSDNGFRYRLSTANGTSGEEIVDFLTNKVGYCQQYAAAMAWLVRAAGIPARVAFGFTRGSADDDGTYTLTNRNLHAWTEVYFSGVGWVPFDATPAYAVSGSARSDWAPDADAPEQPTPSAGATAPSDDDTEAGPQGPDRRDGGVDPGSEGALVADPAPGRTVSPWWLLIVVLVAVVLLAPGVARALRRRRRYATLPAPSVTDTAAQGGTDLVRARTHHAWDELQDLLIDFGVPVSPAQTPRGTAEAVVCSGAGLPDDAAAAARLLGRAEEQARYARRPQVPVDDLVPALTRVRRALAAGADRRTRLSAAVLPASVLRRWQRGVAEAVFRTVAAAARGRAAFERRSPRRFLRRAG